MKYIVGTMTVPKESDLAFEAWDAENSTVMACLLNSMQPEIGKLFLYLSTAKEMWKTVSKNTQKGGMLPESMNWRLPSII